MKKIKSASILAILVFILTACSQSNTAETYISQSLQYALDMAILRRENIAAPDSAAILYLIQRQEQLPAARNRLSSRFQSNIARDYFPVEDAITDIWLLLDLMRDWYGGYTYFGGDEVFIPLFEALEAELLGHGCNVIGEILGLGGDIITLDVFSGILSLQLNSAVLDTHFAIDNRPMNVIYEFYHYTGATYDRSAAGFRNRDTGLYLVEIEGHNIDDTMKLHLDLYGNLFYTPVVLVDRNYLTTADFFYEYLTHPYPQEFIDEQFLKAPIYFIYEGEKQERRQFELYNMNILDGWVDDYFVDLSLPTLEFIDGIPVVKVMIMGHSFLRDTYDLHVAPFLSFAELLQNEPVVIIDLRGNRGGFSAAISRWLYYLTGRSVHQNFVELSARGYSQGQINTDPREIVEIDQKLVFLTDRWTSSAGEVFVDAAFSMTNTLVIGIPTHGVLVASGAHPDSGYSLPNTGLPFGFGSTLYVWPEGHFAEGVGILPDIWVDGDALTAALALLRNSGFGESD